MTALCAEHGLLLVEDCCDALGSTWRGRHVGTFGDLATLSFYPAHQITTGEGGAVLAHSAQHTDRLERLRNQGRGRPGQPRGGEAAAAEDPDLRHSPELGFNYRLSEIACALGRVQLSRIEEILELRRRAAERYRGLLDGVDGIELPPLTVPGVEVSWFVYVVRLAERVDREKVRDHLARNGVATATYFEPIHQQRAWSGLHLGELTVAESVGRRTLALPFFTRISGEQQGKVADALIEAVGN